MDQHVCPPPQFPSRNWGHNHTYSKTSSGTWTSWTWAFNLSISCISVIILCLKRKKLISCSKIDELQITQFDNYIYMFNKHSHRMDMWVLSSAPSGFRVYVYVSVLVKNEKKHKKKDFIYWHTIIVILVVVAFCSWNNAFMSYFPCIPCCHTLLK